MHYPKVVRQISGFTGSTVTAEDLAQEVFRRDYPDQPLQWCPLSLLQC
ncbi:hypothetical protein [Dehalobacter sp. TBBPA1]